MWTTIEQEFRKLAETWKRDTRYQSSVANIAANPAYQAIIAMGWDAVPLILRDLRREPHHWFTALREITGARPIAYEDRGHIEKMAEAWIPWGKSKGYDEPVQSED